MQEKILLNIKELVEYTGICETNIRKILNNPKSDFTIKNGNKLYAHKDKFDKYLEKCAKYHIPI